MSLKIQFCQKLVKFCQRHCKKYHEKATNFETDFEISSEVRIRNKILR